MIKNIIGGIAVGLANIIPGVSGGTMMVILGLFNQVMSSIDGLLKKNNPNRKKDFIFLMQIGIGAVLGLIVFAKILEWLFTKYPTQIMFAFVGMVAFSIPTIVKKEMSKDKFKLIPFALGALIIFGLQIIAPSESDKVITNFPALSVTYLLMMVINGMIAGGAMFVPGVSGSMLLLILGQYYLFTSLIASVTTFQINVLIPLVLIAIGVILGVVVSSKICSYMLDKHHEAMMNFILGLVVASAIVLIPFSGLTSLSVIFTSIVSLVVGGILVILMEKLA